MPFVDPEIRVQVKLLQEVVDYNGSQLCSLYAYRTARIVGDSVIAFRGACDVEDDSMVDLEDRLAGATIASSAMVHFLAEHFGEDLLRTVLRQRMFARLAADLLAERCGRTVRVAGDDLFVGQRKASISVATVSPVSGLFHFAINLSTDRVPVPAIGLDELGVEWMSYATDLLDRYRDETTDISQAAAKVRWVR